MDTIEHRVAGQFDHSLIALCFPALIDRYRKVATPEEALEAVRLLHGVGNDVEAVAFQSVGSQSSYSYSEQCEGQGGGGWGGGTALHGAVVRGAEGLVKWLIAQGVRLDHKMTCGTTALDVAEGSSLGINYNVQPELAAIIRGAMLTQGNR